MAVLSHARPEAIAEKRKLDLRKLPAATAVLAIDHMGLLRMQRQPAGNESFLHGFHEQLCLGATAAVADHIVRIALKRDVQKTPPHPGIKRIMQIQIGQQRSASEAARSSQRLRITAALSWANTERRAAVTMPWWATSSEKAAPMGTHGQFSPQLPRIKGSLLAPKL